VADAWHRGIAMDDFNEEIRTRSDNARRVATRHIERLAEGEDPLHEERQRDIRLVNEESAWLNSVVRERALHLMKSGKYVGLVGGDHSTPLGFMQAVGEVHGDFAILQIDAHADLRNAYEGFEFSHASIMFNALKIRNVQKLVQVGIRDYCQEELDVIRNSAGRVVTFFDRDIKYAQYGGDSWDRICNRIIRELPSKIYLSFDIDGLDPKLCPNTGTPVAGGFETEQVLYLLEKLVSAGKTIVAFDLNEVSAGEGGGDWDANVAARLLYRMANLCYQSTR
jgi:agmatinase